MNLSDTLGIESAGALLLLASLAAVQARAVRGAQRHRIQEMCRRRGQPERYAEILAGSETIAFVAASVVVIAAVVATLLASRSLVSITSRSVVLEASAVAGWILISWLMLVVVPLLVTKFVGARFVVATWGLWKPVVAVIAPVVGLLAVAATALARLVSRRRDDASEGPQDELRLVVDEAHREGRLPGAARAMIEGVMGLDEVRVAQIMTPRTRMISLPVAMPWGEVVRMASESGHTRLPVWGESPDDIVGILHTRELLTQFAERAWRPSPNATAEPPALRPLLRPPYFVPESMSVQKLLRELQRGKTHLAVVTDEFGGVSGVVTIEDALEEIVGEIADEHDEAFSDGMRMVSDDVCEVLGHVRIANVNERFGLRLPEEADFATVGGFVFHEFGRIPNVGDTLTTHGVTLEVLAATRRRVDLVRIERLRDAHHHGG
jgi:putative hemolysin